MSLRIITLARMFRVWANLPRSVQCSRGGGRGRPSHIPHALFKHCARSGGLFAHQEMGQQDCPCSDRERQPTLHLQHIYPKGSDQRQGDDFRKSRSIQVSNCIQFCATIFELRSLNSAVSRALCLSRVASSDPVHKKCAVGTKTLSSVPSMGECV